MTPTTTRDPTTVRRVAASAKRHAGGAGCAHHATRNSVIKPDRVLSKAVAITAQNPCAARAVREGRRERKPPSFPRGAPPKVEARLADYFQVLGRTLAVTALDEFVCTRCPSLRLS